MEVLSLALANLTSPAVLFFALGVLAGVVRSDLNIPQAVAKGIKTVAVSTGKHHTCSILDNGDVLCFGGVCGRRDRNSRSGLHCQNISGVFQCVLRFGAICVMSCGCVNIAIFAQICTVG
mgnify:CR=1 FL=1